MSTNSLRKRSKAPTPQAPSETFAKILPVQPTIAADSELRTRKFLGVAATAVAVVSCASDWHIARQYENNLLHVVFKMMLNFGITAALALIIVSVLQNSLFLGAGNLLSCFRTLFKLSTCSCYRVIHPLGGHSSQAVRQ